MNNIQLKIQSIDSHLQKAEQTSKAHQNKAKVAELEN